ncbi:MAG: hypothetical protein DPW16_01955 [Chloroflexi bacterium]|nr:hypothetical protein [Chloroflexota bacterium]
MGAIAAINHIELVDDGFGGLEPVVAGTKITVHDIVGMFVLGTSSVEWIVENFELTHAQIYAALAYYYDHKATIDREIAEAEAETRQKATSLDEVIRRIKKI